MDGAQPRILEWYRADNWSRMRRVLLTGPTVLTTGGVVIAGSFLTHQKQDLRVASALAGFALIAGGAIFTVAGMHRILREETFLAIRTDGVALRTAAGEAVLAWESLARVHWDAAPGEVVFETAEGAEIRVADRFAGVTGPHLSDRIEQSRRRAAMGFLR